MEAVAVVLVYLLLKLDLRSVDVIDQAVHSRQRLLLLVLALGVDLCHHILNLPLLVVQLGLDVELLVLHELGHLLTLRQLVKLFQDCLHLFLSLILLLHVDVLHHVNRVKLMQVVEQCEVFLPLSVWGGF